MKHLMTTLAASAAFALVPTLSGLASAATNDGTLGSTSNGSLDLTLAVTNPAPEIQISGLNAVNFATEPGVQPAAINEPFCVYMSQAGTFTLRATLQPLLYTDPANGHIEYNVRYKKNNTLKFSVSVRDQEVVATSMGSAPSLEVDCGGGGATNGSLEFRIIDTPNIVDTTTTEILIEVIPE